MNEEVQTKLIAALDGDGVTDEMAGWLASEAGAEYRREIIKTVQRRMNPPKVFRLPCGALPGQCRICNKRSLVAPSISLP